MKRPDHTMSQRPLVRSGMSASKPVLRMVICNPSLAAADLAESASKPMAAFGSVTSAVGKYSSGGYSMSTQSTSCPAVMRLVGGGIAPREPDAATLAGALLAASLGEPEPPCRHAARRIAVAARATNG